MRAKVESELFKELEERKYGEARKLGEKEN